MIISPTAQPCLPIYSPPRLVYCGELERVRAETMSKEQGAMEKLKTKKQSETAKAKSNFRNQLSNASDKFRKCLISWL